MSSGVDWWTAAGSIATAVGVLLGAWQLRRGRTQARTDFEDDLSREYRELTRLISPHAHLDQEVGEETLSAADSAVFHYLDLSNEQVFLRMNGRISKETWLNWRDGIQSNLQRKAFLRVWNLVKERSTSFNELRRLEQTSFEDDPVSWQPWLRRIWQALAA